MVLLASMTRSSIERTIAIETMHFESKKEPQSCPGGSVQLQILAEPTTSAGGGIRASVGKPKESLADLASYEISFHSEREDLTSSGNQEEVKNDYIM